MSQKELDRRHMLASLLPPIRCPVCGAYDNDWPERDGLCCNCWCAAWCAIVDTARRMQGRTPDVAEVQKIIGNMLNDKNRLQSLSKRILEHRKRTGTIRGIRQTNYKRKEY